MSRRRFVALVSAFSILGIGLLVVLGLVVLTNTDSGRDLVRRLLVENVASRVHGKMYIGHVRGRLLGGVTIDSLEIRDDEDSLFLATGPVTVEWSPRDLLDRRVLLELAHVERPVVHIRQHENGEWNFRRVFPSGRPTPPSRRLGWGDFIVATEARVTDGTFILTLPWHPDETLHGARRDSAVRYNLARDDGEIRRTREGYARTWRWTDIDLESPRVRLRHPDSAGVFIRLGELSAVEHDPPFHFRNVSGSVAIRGDSVWVDVPHFDLPASTGRGHGKIVWGSDLPVRYAVHVVGDSVALNDVAWVYPTLPRTGGGKMELDIRNDPQNLHVIDYAISKMDVRTTGSHLTGAMTYGVGRPVLEVKDVDMRAAPMDFELLRVLNGKPFPVDWRGQITGTVRAAGGPLDHFRVDDARFVFRDAHVRGAYTAGRASGAVDILYPAFTRFLGLDVQVDHADLSTVEYLFPNFPRLAGWISGRATLDSSWLDVRFRGADVAYHDGDADLSRLTGAGRVTWGEQFMTYDVDLQALPLSFAALARSYPMLPLRASLQGPIRAKGTVESLELAATLGGAAGTLGFDGHLDAYPPGFAVRGTGSLGRADLRALLGRDDVPASDLTGRFTADVRGDSLGNLEGRTSLALDRSGVDVVRVYPSRAELRFHDGRMLVDTLALETSAATVGARGALGLFPGERDTLRVAVLVDSLGGLRRFIVPAPARAAPTYAALGGYAEGTPGGRASGGPAAPATAAASATASEDPAPADSLDGRLWAHGLLIGSIDPRAALDASGELTGADLYARGDRADSLHASVALRDVLGQPAGTLSGVLVRPLVADVKLREATLDVTLADRANGRFAASATSMNGPSATASGVVRLAGDTTDVRLGALTLRADTTGAASSRRWQLVRGGRVLVEPNGITTDTIVLRDGGTGELALGGVLPHGRPIDFFLQAHAVALGDLGALAQSAVPLGGRLDGNVHLTGLRVRPVLRGALAFTDLRAGGVHAESLTVATDYGTPALGDRRLHAHAALTRGGRTALVADLVLPVDLALLPVRRRILDDSVSGYVRADSADLALLETLSPDLQEASGRLSLYLAVGGTLHRPAFDGAVRVANGRFRVASLGVGVQQVNADVVLKGDSLSIDRLSLLGAGEEGGSASLAGWLDLGSLALDRGLQPFNPRFAFTLTARGFHAISRRSFADLRLSTAGLTLNGSLRAATLSGSIRVDKGSVYIPELSRQRPIDLNDPDFYAIVDTSVYANRVLVPDAPARLLENLSLQNVQVVIGDEVWLRSAEANIQLGGQLNVTLARDERAPRIGGAFADSLRAPQLALQGALLANRGQYRLDLGPAVQRTFQVTRGTLTFSGAPDLNPALDISAVHTVTTEQQQDIRVRVNIGGTLMQPTLSFSSDEGFRMEQGELISYLLTGRPSFLTGAQANDPNARTSSALASVILPTAGSAVEQALQRGLGGTSLIQFQMGAINPDAAKGLTDLAQQGLATSRVGLGWQINERTYVSATTGLCPYLKSDQQQDQVAAMRNALGLKVEHRLAHGFSLSAGLEPSAADVSCLPNSQNVSRTLPQAPRQMGFDLLRTWSF